MNDIFSIHTFQNKLYLSIVNVALIKGYFPSYLDQRIFFILIFFTVDDKCILNLESILIYIKEIVVWSFLSLISCCKSFPHLLLRSRKRWARKCFGFRNHIYLGKNALLTPLTLLSSLLSKLHMSANISYPIFIFIIKKLTQS